MTGKPTTLAGYGITDAAKSIITEKSRVTLKENWFSIKKSGYSLIMAIAYREDSTFSVTGFSKHIY